MGVVANCERLQIGLREPYRSRLQIYCCTLNRLRRASSSCPRGRNSRYVLDSVVWSSCEEQKMHVNTHPLLGPDNNGLNYEGNSPFVGGNVLGEFPLLVAAQTASILSLRPRNRIITCDLGWLENSGGRLTPEHGRRDISQSRECLAKEVDPSQRRSDTPLPTIDRNAVTLEGLNHFEQCSCQQGEL